MPRKQSIFPFTLALPHWSTRSWVASSLHGCFQLLCGPSTAKAMVVELVTEGVAIFSILAELTIRSTFKIHKGSVLFCRSPILIILGSFFFTQTKGWSVWRRLWTCVHVLVLFCGPLKLHLAWRQGDYPAFPLLNICSNSHRWGPGKIQQTSPSFFFFHSSEFTPYRNTLW